MAGGDAGQRDAAPISLRAKSEDVLTSLCVQPKKPIMQEPSWGDGVQYRERPLFIFSLVGY